MPEISNSLRNCPLFEGIDDDSIGSMLSCLGAETRSIPKNSPVFLEGEPANHVWLVLSGSVQILRDDIDGSRSLMSAVGEGDLFAEIFACAGVERYPVSAYALSDSTVTTLDLKRLLRVCGNACAFHSALISNLLRVVSRKTLALNRKIGFMSRRTTREKLLAFLHDQAKENRSREFTIPFDRQALADYLGVERSGMSVELSRLKKEGILDTRGSWFRLLM